MTLTKDELMQGAARQIWDNPLDHEIYAFCTALRYLRENYMHCDEIDQRWSTGTILSTLAGEG